MSKLIFYCFVGSPSSRAVRYVAEQLGIELNIENININSRAEENLEISPMQLSTLDDNGIYIYGSGSIMIYLVEKYGETDDLYPKDLVRRAKVNSMLFFETQFLFGRLRTAVEPFFEIFKQTTFVEYLFSKVHDSLDRLERILAHNGTDFIADNSITISDFTCISTIASIEVFLKLDESKYPMITKWKNRLYLKFPEMKRIEQQNAHDFKMLLGEVQQMRLLMDSDTTKAN